MKSSTTSLVLTWLDRSTLYSNLSILQANRFRAMELTPFERAKDNTKEKLRTNASATSTLSMASHKRRPRNFIYSTNRAIARVIPLYFPATSYPALSDPREGHTSLQDQNHPPFYTSKPTAEELDPACLLRPTRSRKLSPSTPMG